jgi:hypothetical protein
MQQQNEEEDGHSIVGSQRRAEAGLPLHTCILVNIVCVYRA